MNPFIHSFFFFFIIITRYIANIGRYLLKDCHNTTLSYNPEFIAQGDIVNGFFNCDMVLIGEGSKEAGEQIEAIYRNTVNPNAAYCRYFFFFN